MTDTPASGAADTTPEQHPPGTFAQCPIQDCQWEYELAEVRTECRDEKMVAFIPSPAGVSSTETAAGIRAARAVLAEPAAGFDDVLPRLLQAAREQDDAVLLVHLSTHPRQQLRAAFGDRYDEVMTLLAYQDSPAYDGSNHRGGTLLSG